MALTPQNNEAFFREVDEELRRDQLTGFWKRWGPWLAGAVILALAAFATYLWINAHNERKAETAGEQFTLALDDVASGDLDAAKKELDGLAANENVSYRGLAQLTQAAAKMGKGDLAGAGEIYREIASDTNMPQVFRDLATVRATAAEFDSLPPEKVIERLKPLAVADNPWFGSAGEMTAIALLKLKRPEEAGALLSQLVRDDKTPESIRGRASRLAASQGLNIDEFPAVGTEEE